MKKVKVSIAKTQDPYVGVREVIEMLDPQYPSIRGSKVLLKPNLASAVPPEEGPQVTHPDVIGALIRYFKDRGAQKIFVGDEPSWGLGARFCFKNTGIQEVVEKEGGKLVYFDEEKRITKKIAQGRVYRALSLPAVLDEVDLLINVPKMKTSLMSLVTLCVKNLFGLASFRDRKRFHRGVDLSYALIDIAKIVRPHLNVMDGILASEGMSAHSGTPYPLGVLIASQDMVAADIVGTQVMGFNPMEPVTNQLALKDGLGIKNLEQIELVGAPLAEVRATLERPVFRLVHPEPNVEVIPGGICPGCIGRIPKIPPQVEENKRYGIVIGKRVSFPKDQDFDEIWCFGDCGIEECDKIVKQFPELKGRMKKVSGCPPLDWWREQTAQKELKEKGLL
jgi:uncharacterized protein (DUF362 family)